MVALQTALTLAGYALGTIGGVLLFMEFFQVPSYVEFDEDFGAYNVDIAPQDVQEHTWLGRTGALSISLAFALLFVAEFL